MHRCRYELSKILYQRNGTVYVAGRSPAKAEKAIKAIQQAHPGSKGRLEFLKLDLGDLAGIKGSSMEFLGREERLDVLVNNGTSGASLRGPRRICYYLFASIESKRRFLRVPAIAGHSLTSS